MMFAPSGLAGRAVAGRASPISPLESALEAHERASLDGFHQTGARTKEAFFVSDPDARWVARNLLDGMKAEPVPGGIRVTIETSALPVLGRFVVGLGAAAKPLTLALQGEVARLARGALASLELT
jgi:hypothetical protein